MPSVTLNLLVLKTRQLNRLRGFYAALGLDFAEEKHGDGPTHHAARLDDLVLELYPLPSEATAADSTTRLGFQVADLDALLRTLESAGASVVGRPQRSAWGYRAVVRDPDGRVVELTQG
jgi:predicted enzyme related to lactoylglutathione lyase